MYVVKKSLTEKPTVEIRARPSGAAQVVRVAEALKRLGYVSYDKYFTTSEVQEGNLLRFIVVRLRKTDNFDKLYAERETERQTRMACASNVWNVYSGTMGKNAIQTFGSSFNTV